MATELANAYISLSIETSRVPGEVRKMFGGVSRQADQAGKDAGNRFSSGMAGGLKTLAGAVGIAGGIAGVAAAFKSVVTTGMDFTTSMNTMKAVSSASAVEMDKVSAAARQLANDTSLPATSATDAAAAMVELAKGGFTVEQSMQAARGTLQLAAAAQIEAGQAATIQSQALQAFGQNASYAGTAADILANAANASSAEIVDVASALQQSGTVANQFGLSMQDTAAAIAMMANAGIQGSDAGTLLKSALLALTDQGKPAQGAIEELGLTVYDAQGKFVGLSKLFGELDAASKSMTDEQYQAATATLFGSDAMRLAGIAAQQGAEGYDKMVVAMGRQGSAAEVAAAKTEGLPGAWERFKNSVEDVSLSVYDAIEGPLTSALAFATNGLGNLMSVAKDAAPAVGGFMSKMVGGLQDAYRALQDSGKLEEWAMRLRNIWAQLGEAIDNVGPIIMQFSAIAAKAAAAMGLAAWEGFLAVLESTSEILNVAVVPMLQLLADVAGASEIATVGLVAAFLLFKMIPAVMGSVRGALAPVAGQAQAATGAMRGFGDQMRLQQRLAAMGGQTLGRYGAAMAALQARSQTLTSMATAYRGASGAVNAFSLAQTRASVSGSALGQGFARFRQDMQLQQSLAGMAGRNIGALGSAYGVLRTRLSGVSGPMSSFRQQMQLQRSLAAMGGQSLGTMGAAYAALRTQVSGMSGPLSGFRQQMRLQQQLAAMGGQSIGRMGSSFAVIRTQLSALPTPLAATTGGIRKLASVSAGAGAAGLAGLRAGASGLASVFGGPLAMGLTAVVIGGMAWMSSVQKQKGYTDAYKASLDALNDEQKNMASILSRNGGNVNDEVYSSLTQQVENYTSSLESASKADAKWTDNVADGWESFAGALTGIGNGSDNTSKKLDEAASEAKAAAEAIDNLGYTSEQVGQKIGGSAEQWATFKSRLEGMGDGGRKAATDLQLQRDVLVDLQNIAKLTTPGITDMQTAMRLLSDDTASAADKTNALKSALDALNPARSKGEALAQHNSLMRDVADATKEATDQTKGFGDSLGGMQGVIDGTTENGESLRQSLIDIVDATAAAKANNADMSAVYAKNAEAFRLMAQQNGVDIGIIQAAADALGMSDLDLIIKSSGGDEVLQTMSSVKKAFDETPGAKTINMELGQVSKESADQLRELGYLVTDLPNEKVTRIQVKDDSATSTLNAVVSAINAYDGKVSIADLDLNKVPFDLKDQQAISQLAGLDRATVSPEAGLTIDKLLQGKSVSMSELAILDQTTSNPVVDMIIDAIMEKIRVVNEGLDNAATTRNAYIDVVTRGDMGVPGRDPMISGPPSSANGSVREYADGGIQSLPDHALIQKPDPKGGLVQWAEPETGGEVFIPLAQSKRSRSLSIWRKAGELLGVKNAQQYADGGIRSSDFDELAAGGFGASRPLTGAPYVWGGINWGDCSGAMSAFANMAAGLPIFGSRFATASQAGELARRGARPGRGSLGDLIFGWLNGGPGGGHTAGILPSGKAVEMGGSNDGGMVGGNPDFGQFTDWAHFPSSMFGPSWSDPGSDPGGFVMRPDGKIVPASSYDYSASGSGSSSSGTDRSLSGMLGNAASTAVSGQVQDLLSIFSIPDKPSALSAIDEYNRVTEERQSQWTAAQKSRSDLEAQQSTDLSTAATDGTVAAAQPIIYDDSKGAEQWDPYMLQVLRKLRKGQGLLSNFREQVQIESKGDPYAVNADYTAPDGSNPTGLGQAIQSTFNAHKSKDFADDIFDPLANLFAVAHYVENDPKFDGRGIAGVWPTADGYKDGGPIRGPGGGRSDAVPMWGSNGEFMVTAPDYGRNRWAVDAIHSGATLKPAASGRDSSGPRVVYNIQAGNTERAFNEAQRLEKKRNLIGLGSI